MCGPLTAAAIEVKNKPQNHALNQRLLLRLTLYQLNQAQAMRNAVNKPSSASVTKLTDATDEIEKIKAGQADL
jgi:hypothetical protein